jgi:fatty-acyl-CoA synthase
VEVDDLNIAAHVQANAERHGDQPALSDAERALDYAELADRFRRCASVLAKAGVGPGDRIALLMGNRTPFIEIVLAAAQLGAVVVPLNARLTAWEIRRQLDDSTPRVIAYDSPHAAVAESACAEAASPPGHHLRCGDLHDSYEAALAASSPHREFAAVDPEDPLMILYTSGTTGMPKGAVLPHRKTIYNGLNAAAFFGITPDDRVLVTLPLFHSFGISILSLPALQHGASVTLHPRFDAKTVWKTVEREGISYFGGVPTMFQSLLESLESATQHFDLHSLRFMFTSGAAIPVERIHEFQEHGLVLKQGYGQTETSTLCCLDSADAVRKAGSVGRAVKSIELRVVASNGFDAAPEDWRDVPAGEIGEIVVKGPITMTGYWHCAEQTAETLRGDWLRTHDLATIDAEGFVTLVGRARDLYISGGENVYPAEVEAVFEEHEAVREIAVVGISNERWGEVGRAYVVAEHGIEIDADALLAWGSARHARFKLPQEVVVLDVLPRTVSGKVQKHRLPGLEPRPEDEASTD